MTDKPKEPFGLVDIRMLMYPQCMAHDAGVLLKAQRALTLAEVKARVDIWAEDKHATSPSMMALQDWLAESMRELGIELEETLK